MKPTKQYAFSHCVFVCVAHLILVDKMHARLFSVCFSFSFFSLLHRRYNSIVLLFFIFQFSVMRFLLLLISLSVSLLLARFCVAASNDARSLFNNVHRCVVLVHIRDARCCILVRESSRFYIIKPCGSNLKTQSTTSNNSFKKIKYQIVRAHTAHQNIIKRVHFVGSGPDLCTSCYLRRITVVVVVKAK